MGYVYNCFGYYYAIAVDFILDTHKYLMKMFGLIKKCFFNTIALFGCTVLNVNPLKYVSMNIKECIARPELININSNEPYFIVKVIK